jgi:sterol carrier protein 2
VYELGLTGVPIYNVNNNCSSGASALMLANQWIKAGNDCVMAIGFEKMQTGSLSSKWDDRTIPLDKHMEVMVEARGFAPAPPAAQMFGNAGLEHHEKFGSDASHLVKIAHKNHAHSVNNPYSQFQEEYSMEQISKDRKVFADLTRSMCCPTSDGGACCIVASEEFVRKHGLEGQAVEIVGQSMKTDFPSSFKDASCIKMVGADMTRAAADEAYAQAGVKASDVQVCELHDCFAANELITYEGLRLCKDGEAHKYVDAGDNDYGGKGCVVNPSGGLISKGHPLGATGLAQASEMVWQLRGEAGKRQVKNVKVALTHNLGLGGAAVVTLYKRPEEWKSKAMKRKISLGASIPKDLQEEPSFLKAAAKL